MKPYKPDWYGRLKSGPFSERTFGRAQMARVEERLRRGDVGGRRGARWAAWGFGAAAVCAVGALLLVKVAGLGPQPAITVSPPPGTTAVSPAPTAAPSAAPQITEAQALQIAKQHNPDSTVVWSATLDPAYKSAGPSAQGVIPVWNVVGQYPAGNKDAYVIDARNGKVLANREEEAPPLLDQAKAIEQMHMFDESHGWSWNAQGVWHTSNGADGWTKVTPQGVALASLADGNARPRMTFLDDATAVLALTKKNSPQVTVYRTTNSGKTWNSATFKSGWTDQDVPTILNITFADRTHGWILLGFGAGMGSEQVALYATQDGGSSWNLASGNEPGKPSANGIPFSGMKSGLVFSDAMHGFLSGNSAAPGPYFYGTTDGGTTWNAIKLPVPAGINEDAMSTTEPVFVSADDGWLAVPFSTSDGKRQTLMYTTQDGGRSWRPGATVPGFANREPIVSYADAGTAYLTDGMQWYKVGSGGSILDSWSMTDKRFFGVRGLQFLNANTGFAIMDTRVWITRDGGHTWNMAW